MLVAREWLIDGYNLARRIVLPNLIVHFSAYLPRTRDIRDTYLTIDRQDTDEIPCQNLNNRQSKAARQAFPQNIYHLQHFVFAYFAKKQYLCTQFLKL